MGPGGMLEQDRGTIKLPALSPRGSPRTGQGSSSTGSPKGPESPADAARYGGGMDPVPGDLRAEASGPLPQHGNSPHPLPPRAQSTPPELHPEGKLGVAVDASAWPHGSARGGRSGGSGLWTVREGGRPFKKSPVFSDPQISAARSQMWAQRSGMHAAFTDRGPLSVPAGEGELLPTASAKRLDQRLSRQATTWDAAPGVSEEGTPKDWQDLQYATAMAGASLARAPPSAALTQIELSPGQMGSLSPHHLKSVHGMSEADVQRLYRALRVYTLGFHEVMEDVCGKAAERRGLLVKVWRLFARLWDSSLQVVFDSEVLAMGAERERAVAQVEALQAEAGALRQENRMIRDKVNEMVNHALTRVDQEKSTGILTTALHEELSGTKRAQEELSQQAERDRTLLKEREEELYRMKKELYRTQALLQAREDDLELSTRSLGEMRGGDAALRQTLREAQLQVEEAERRATQAIAERDAALEEKVERTKLAEAAKHDMFEERRAKRLLQVDVEHVRGEIKERREEVRALRSEIQGYVDGKDTAEAQVREAVKLRQRETDRAEEYERDIQTLVVMFNHMQDEVTLNDELKASLQAVKSLLEEKRAKKKAWKQRCMEHRETIAEMKREGKEWREAREAEVATHNAEVASLLEDVRKVEATNKDLHARIKPLRIELSDVKQKMGQTQMARTTAKLRLEAANKRTAALVDSLAENIRILNLTKEALQRAKDGLDEKTILCEQQEADMRYLKEEHAVEVTKLKGELKKAEDSGDRWEAQMAYVREQAREKGEEVSSQLTDMQKRIIELERDLSASDAEMARMKFKADDALRVVDELKETLGDHDTKLEAAHTELKKMETASAMVDKYRGWLKRTGEEIKGAREELSQFLSNEPSAPVGDERAWSGLADGVLGTAAGEELETEEVLIKLDNHWEDLLQEKSKLVSLLHGLRDDRDSVKDQYNDLLTQYEDMEEELTTKIAQSRMDTELVIGESQKAKEERETSSQHVAALTKTNSDLELRLAQREEALRGLEAELSALKAAHALSTQEELKAMEQQQTLTARVAKLESMLKLKESDDQVRAEAGEELDKVTKEQKEELTRIRVENSGLKDELHLLKGELENAKSQAESVSQQLDAKKRQLEQIEGELMDMNNNYQTAKSKLSQLESSTSGLTVAKREVAQADEEILSLKRQLEEMSAEMDARDAELVKAQAVASSAAGATSEKLRTQLDTLSVSMHAKVDELEAVIATQLQDMEKKDKKIKALESLDIEKIQRDLEDRLQEMEETKTNVYRSLVKAEDELADTKRDLEAKVAELEELLAQEKTKANTVEAVSGTLQSELRAANHRLTQLHQKAVSRELVEVWCGSLLQAAEGEEELELRWSPTSLSILIGKLYCQKLAADLSDVADGAKCQTMREFVYDFFLFKTGLRAMAEDHLQGVIDSVKSSCEDSLRIKTFGSLVGHSSCPSWPREAESAFMSVLSHIYALTGGPSDTEDSDGRTDVAIAKAVHAAKEALPGINWDGLESILVAGAKGGSSTGLDDVLSVVMKTWLAESESEASRAEELFFSFDSNRDSVLSYDEFAALVSKVEGSANDRRVRKLFDDCLAASGNSGQDSMPLSAFSSVTSMFGPEWKSALNPAPLRPLAKEISVSETVMLKDLLPTLTSACGDVCKALEGNKSLAEELDNMQKLLGVVRGCVEGSGSGTEVWAPYRRFLLLLSISRSRHVLISLESKAALGASAFSTTLRENFSEESPRKRGD